MLLSIYGVSAKEDQEISMQYVEGFIAIYRGWEERDQAGRCRTIAVAGTHFGSLPLED